MRNLKLILAIILIGSFANAQDSTKVKTKMFNHEIGFNAVTLIRQVVVFNPGTAEQLPFDLFYNLYYKDIIGIRIGAGIFSNTLETQIEGQRLPKTTATKNMNFREGISYNFGKFGRVTLNAFADFVTKKQSLETSTTNTLQTFPNPITTQTSKLSQTTNGIGGQVGVGLKINVYRLLSFYVEVPVSYMKEISEIEDSIRETGLPDVVTKTTSTSSGTKIALPTTVYLVLRF